MNLSTVIILAVLVSTSAGATWQLRRIVRVWRRIAGERLVTCPGTGRTAAVRIDVPHAILSSLTAKTPEMRLADCSQWATGAACDRSCLIEALEPDSTARGIAASWYAKKNCVYCGKPIGVAQSFGHRAALLTPEGTTHEWSTVPTERLLDSLRTDWPVCWNCHVAETLRREHPTLVTDRPWPQDPDRRRG